MAENEGCLTVLRQLRACTAAKIVAMGRGLDRSEVLNMVRAGADDYLDVDDEMERELERLHKRLSTELAVRGGKGKVLAITSAGGGCGCSTMAVNLAAVLALEHGSCGLLDLNLKGGDLATLLALKQRHSIADLCSHPQLERAIFEQSLLPHECGIRLLASPPMLEPFGHIDVARIEEVVDLASQCFPHVVIDLEDSVHREQFRVVSTCDTLLVALRLDFVSLLRTRKQLLYLEREGVDMQKIRLVANRCGTSGEVSLRKAQEALGQKISHAIPENSKVVLAANNMGVPIVVDAPTSNVSKVYRELALSLIVT